MKTAETGCGCCSFPRNGMLVTSKNRITMPNKIRARVRRGIHFSLQINDEIVVMEPVVQQTGRIRLYASVLLAAEYLRVGTYLPNPIWACHFHA